MVSSTDPLQDLGLQFVDALARLLPVGVLVIADGGDCRYASPLARAALGVSDGNATPAWRRIAADLDLDRRIAVHAGDSPLQLLADLSDDASRRLRLEVHQMYDLSIVLLRDVLSDDAPDRTLLLATEAQAHRRALSGLVHEAKGPLNNFQLTLALLEAGLVRLEENGAARDVTARWRRHFDVLQSETARLTLRLGEIDALAHPADDEWAQVDITALLRNVMHLLRHDATMTELAFDVDAPPDAINVRGDARTLRLALLGLTACVFEATPPGGLVRLTAERRADTGVHVHIDATTTRLPIDLQTAMFRIGCAIDPRYLAASAARVIIEAHGGTVVLQTEGGAVRGFDLRLPDG